MKKPTASHGMGVYGTREQVANGTAKPILFTLDKDGFRWEFINIKGGEDRDDRNSEDRR